MLSTLRTLMAGSAARAETQLRDTFAIELIDQKVRETESQVHAAKATLATLIQRERTESRLLAKLRGDIAEMETRTVAALDAGKDGLAAEGAQAIATMENEATLRDGTVARLQEKIMRLRTSVETGHRKVVELKQGAMAAAAVKKEAAIQSNLARTGINPQTSAQEAQDLINRVMTKDDPFEMGQIMDDIDAGLSGASLADRMAAQGCGDATKSNAADVLARLKK